MPSEPTGKALLPGLKRDPLGLIIKNLNFNSLGKLAMASKEMAECVNEAVLELVPIPEPLRSRQENPGLRVVANLKQHQLLFQKLVEELKAGTATDKVSQILRDEMTDKEREHYAALGQGQRIHENAAKYIKAYIVADQVPNEPRIQKRISDYLTHQEHDHQLAEAFASPFIRACLIKGYLTVKEVLDTSYCALLAFKIPKVQDYLISRALSFREVLGISYEAYQALCYPAIHRYLAAGKLSLKQVLNISRIVLRVLTAPAVLRYLDDEKLSFAQVLGISEAASGALLDPAVHRYLDDEKLSFAQVLGASYAVSGALKNPAVQRYLADGKLSFAQVLGISHAASYALSSPAVQRYLDDGILSFAQILGISHAGSQALGNSTVQRYIDDGILSFEQVLVISFEAYFALSLGGIRAYEIEVERQMYNQAALFRGRFHQSPAAPRPEVT